MARRWPIRSRRCWRWTWRPAPRPNAPQPAAPSDFHASPEAALDLLPASIRTPLAFVVVLGVLVFVHELGHYLAARWRGVHVEAFAIGFGRPLVTWRDRLGTQWRVGWLPLGGYVKLHGQETPEDATPEQRAAWRTGETFHGKSVLSRAIVVGAGPIANLLLAAVLFSVLFATVGRPVRDAPPTTVIGAVARDSAAAAAGLLPGDQVLALDGQLVTRFEDIQHHVQPRAGVPIAVRVRRDGAERTLTAIPRPSPAPAAAAPVPPAAVAGAAPAPAVVGLLGIGPAPAPFERLDPVSAIGAGVARTGEVVVDTLAGLGQMLSGARGTEELGGPLRIAALSGEVAELGFAALLGFMALLSVSIALINLFPIPVLDGGHLLFYAAEAIRGRPLPQRAQEYGFRAGFALLVTLFVFATWNDLTQLGIFRRVLALFG